MRNRVRKALKKASKKGLNVTRNKALSIMLIVLMLVSQVQLLLIFMPITAAAEDIPGGQAYDKDYYEKLKRDNLSDGYYSNHNFAEKFKAAPGPYYSNSANGYIGNCITSNSRYAKNIEFYAQYDFDEAGLIALNAKKGNLEIGLVLYSKNTKVSRGIVDIFIEPDYFESHAYLYGYKSNGQSYLIKEYFWGKTEASTKGAGDSNEIAWMSIKEGTVGLGLKLTSTGPEGSGHFTPSTRFENPQIYIRDIGGPMILAANGNGNIKAGENAEITLEYDEDIYILDDKSIPDLDGKGVIQGESSKTKTMTFKYIDKPSKNKLRFRSAVPANEINELDLYSFNISKDNQAAISECLADEYGNSPKESSRPVVVSNLKVDNVPPEIKKVFAVTKSKNTQGNNKYTAGDTILFKVQFSETIEMTDNIKTSTLTLNNDKTIPLTLDKTGDTSGDTNRERTILNYTYTVNENDENTSRLDIADLGDSEIELTYSGDIKDICGNVLHDTAVVKEGSNFIAGMFFVDTVAPSITIKNKTEDFSDSTLKRRYALFQVNAADENKLDLYYLTADGSFEMAVSNSLIDESELAGDSYPFAKSEGAKGPGELEHYLYIKGLSEGEMSLTFSMTDAAGNHEEKTESLFFDTGAPVVDIGTIYENAADDAVTISNRITARDRLDPESPESGEGIGVDWGKVMYMWEEGPENSSEYAYSDLDDPYIDRQWYTPSGYESQAFNLPAQTIAKNTIFDKTLHVKAEDMYGNKTEISRRLYADRNINILISEPENKGEIASEFDIILDGSTNRNIRIAWSGSDTYPSDEEFMAVFEAVYMADVNLGSLEMQGNYENYRRKWNEPFTGDFKLYVEWYDTDSLLWRPYGDPALYRFSNSYPRIDQLEFISGSDYFNYRKGKNLPVLHVIQKEEHIYNGCGSSKSYPLDAKNGTAKLIGANDEEIASIPMPSGSDFIFDLNQYFDIPAPGRYKLSLDTITYGGKSNGPAEIEFVLDPLAPVIENLPVGEDGAAKPVTFEPDQLKLDGYKYMDDGEEVRLPYYMYWMKVKDEPYIYIGSHEYDHPLRNLDRSVHLYYSVDAVSFDVVKDRTEEEDWDPSAGLERYYLNVGSAADADFYKGGRESEMPATNTLYHIEALDGRGDSSDEDCHMILPDEWPDGIGTDGYQYIPVYIPVKLDKLDGQMKLNYVIVDSVGNFGEGELLFRCDINPPAVDLSYSSYEETSTGPITVTIANIHDAYTPSEKLRWCFPYESEAGGGGGANVWNTLGDYRAFSLELNRENCMNSPILAFKDESGNTNTINVKPQWFITDTPDLAVDFIDPDDTDIINYTLDPDWQTNGNPIPFVKDSIKAADSYVTFDVESNDLGERHPIYIAFSDETPWNTGGTGDGETPETWILLDDGIDFPWLKVTALPENEQYSAYRVKVLPRPSIANEGINQLFIMTHDRLGNENVIGTLNKNKMEEMKDSIILLNTGDKENGVAGTKLTENRLSTGEVQSMTAEITFEAGVYASIKDINNIKLPRNIESYSKTYSFTFTENKEHVIYYADIYGQVYSEKLPISGITEGLFPDIATNPSTPTNSGSATLVIDATGVDGMSFKGVEISGAAIIPDGTIGEDSGGETIYKKLTCTVTQNTTINYTVIRNSTEYDGSYELKLFDREEPSAQLEYSFMDAVSKEGKTSGRVVAALTDIDDNFGGDGIEVYISTGDSLVDVTNSPNYIFTENGSIDFILSDGAGNERIIKAGVSCIDKSLAVENGQPLGFLASFYSQSGGSLTYLGESSMLDEYSCVIAPYAHVRENVIVKILPVSQKEVTASLNNPLPEGEIEPLDDKNLQYRFLNGEAELSLTLKEDPGSGDSDEITIRIKANIDREAPSGYVSYETQADDSIHAILIVSDNITAFENLLFDDDDVLPKKEDGSRYKVFAENGDYTFTVRDAAGNASKFPVNVRLFDATLPEILSISYSPAKIGANFLTNNDVVVTISFSEPVTRFETLKGGAKVSLEHTSVSISGRTGYAIFSQNEEFTLRFYDASGNFNETTLDVDYIDKQKPQVYLDVSYNDPKHDTATIEIKREPGEERELLAANNTFTYTVTRDGAYNYTVSDKLGNMTVLTAIITGIDAARRIPDITAEVLNTDEITQGPVDIRFVSDMDVTSLMFGEKVSLKKGIPHTVKVNSNGVYSFCFTTEFARVKEIKVKISNIDNKPPRLMIFGPANPVYYVNDPDFNQEALLDYEAIDERDGDLTESVAVDWGSLDIGKAGVYSIQYSVADRAGNTASAARTVEVVEKGLFEITLDDGTGPVRKILANGQRVIVNSNSIGIIIHSIDGVPVSAKIKAGLLNPAQMKAGTANIENERFTVQGSGWYTILAQDAWLRRQYFNVFVSAE